MTTLLPIDQIERKIYSVRGLKVMLDADLAQLYGVPTKRLTEQVRRNINRFPDDFLVRLTIEESQNLLNPRSQFASLDSGTNVKYPHLAFTEEGIGMLSSVLRSERAVQVNIMIVRAFVRFRSILSTHKELAVKLEDLERSVRTQNKRLKNHGHKIKQLFNAIWELMNAPKSPIGFNK